MTACLPSNKKRQNSTNFQIPEDCVAMETKLCIQIKELILSEGWFMYVVLIKHYLAYILCFLSKLCKYECVWCKLYDFRHVKRCKF